MNDLDDLVVDKSIEEDNSETPPAASSGSAESVLKLEGMINRFLADIDKLKEQSKAQKQMFDDAFKNDAEYAKQNDKVKEETKKRTGIKQRILKQPAVAQLQSKLNELKEEVKDAQSGLASYVQRYYQVSGSNQIMGTDGEMREIILVPKLVKKSQ
jgi:predicted nuclease with TOPRIM domain